MPDYRPMIIVPGSAVAVAVGSLFLVLGFCLLHTKETSRFMVCMCVCVCVCDEGLKFLCVGRNTCPGGIFEPHSPWATPPRCGR